MMEIINNSNLNSIGNRVDDHSDIVLKRILARLDHNSDGVVSSYEADRSLETIRYSFDLNKYDLNGDKRISFIEQDIIRDTANSINNYLDGVGVRSSGTGVYDQKLKVYLDDVLTAMDTNHDGIVTYTEAEDTLNVATARERRSEFDVVGKKNGRNNGKISSDEFTAFRKYSRQVKALIDGLSYNPSENVILNPIGQKISQVENQIVEVGEDIALNTALIAGLDFAKQEFITRPELVRIKIDLIMGIIDYNNDLTPEELASLEFRLRSYDDNDDGYLNVQQVERASTNINAMEEGLINRLSGSVEGLGELRSIVFELSSLESSDKLEVEHADRRHLIFNGMINQDSLAQAKRIVENENITIGNKLERLDLLITQQISPDGIRTDFYGDDDKQNEILRAMDRDGDGLVSHIEALYAKHASTNRVREDSYDYEKVGDQRGNGTVSSRELRNIKNYSKRVIAMLEEAQEAQDNRLSVPDNIDVYESQQRPVEDSEPLMVQAIENGADYQTITHLLRSS